MAERARLKAIAEESVRLMESSLSAGDPLGVALRRAIDRIATYTPEDNIYLRHPFKWYLEYPEVVVTNMRSLQAVHELAKSGFSNLAVLNFASARRPGRDFLDGTAGRQEESLARCSGIHFCIRHGEVYRKRNADRWELYTHHVVYSLEVPVFRDEGREHEMLGEGWYKASFITARAVDVGLGRRRGASRQEIEAAMFWRIMRLLWVVAHNSHWAVVLGAFGCGTCGNEPAAVARLFSRALGNVFFEGRFMRVVFAVPELKGDRKRSGGRSLGASGWA